MSGRNRVLARLQNYAKEIATPDGALTVTVEWLELRHGGQSGKLKLTTGRLLSDGDFQDEIKNAVARHVNELHMRDYRARDVIGPHA